MPADITNLNFSIVFILASPIFPLWFHNKLQNINNNYMHTKAVKGVNLFLCVIVKSNCRVKSELFAVLQLEIWYGIRNTSSEPFSSWLLQQSCISVGIATSQVKQKNCIASECTTITYPFITYVLYYDLFLQIVTLCGRNLTMDRYGWLLIPLHLHLAEWRCTKEISGELCVQETLGRQQRILCADSLGTLAQLPFLWLPGSQ